MDTRLADVVALMGLAFALPAALAAVPGDEADHQRYYNLHQRMKYGVRSGQPTAEEADGSGGRGTRVADAASDRPQGMRDGAAGSRAGRKAIDAAPARPGAMRSDNS